VRLARILKLEVGAAGSFDRPPTPEEIMDQLEERVGPEGRKLFENFLEQVNKLQAEQQQCQLEQQRQRRPVSPSALPVATRSKVRLP
jgi:hypothetical protein